MRKTVLIISPRTGVGGGAEALLVEFLRAWNSSIIELIVLSPKNGLVWVAASKNGFLTYDFPNSGIGHSFWGNLRATRKVSQILPKADLVFAWTIRTFHCAVWLARKRKVPCMGTLHDNPFPSEVRSTKARGLKSTLFYCQTWLRWQLAHLAANRLTHLVCVSNVLKAECQNKGYKCPLSVILPGLSDIDESRVDSERPRIGFLGMNRPDTKGFPIVKDWIEKTEGGFLWCLYGSAALKVIDEVDELVSTGDVDYRGQKPQLEIFQDIDVLVQASTVFETFGMVLAEAARVGIPCVATDNGGSREIIRDGVSGFIFNAKDPDGGLGMLKKLLDPELRKEMGYNARRVFENRFRVERMVEEYRECFCGLIRIEDKTIGDE